MDEIFLAGYSRVCITPAESVPLAGYGNTSKRMSQSVTSDLYCTCLAFTDPDGQTLLLMSNDLILTSDVWARPAREAVSAATGVPVENIVVSATHTHSGPDLGNTDIPSIPRYRQAMATWMTQAAVAAMADRKPATLFTGSTHIEKVNFVRHYVLDNGTFAGDNYGDFHSGAVVNHATEADRTMQILKFAREGGKDIIVVNWQTHPHRSGGGKRFDITADIVGGMRDSMEEKLDCCFAYFSGAGGNVNTRSRDTSRNLDGDHVVCGAYMADHVIAALPSLTPAATGRIRCAHQVYSAKTNHTQDHLAEIGLQLRREWERTGDAIACREAGRPYGIHSPYHALAIYSKSKLPATRDVPLTVCSIGDVAFVAAPYEMFDTSGMQIKHCSAYPMTFVCTCANDYVGYIPSAFAYQYGCYEADCTPLAPGTAEELVVQYLGMLARMRKEN